jgi:uncharacterized protein YegP (UPF0339 family)
MTFIRYAHSRHLLPRCKYRLRLKASNGQLDATSEACETKAAAKTGCESVQSAAPEATVGEVNYHVQAAGNRC